MAGNKNLNKANKAKKDEFYTQMDDITNELRHYMEHFRGKTVLCNCDDPYESNFFKYFALNFYFLGLKKLICTCWHKSPIVETEFHFSDDTNDSDIAAEPTINITHGSKIEITEILDLNNDGAIDLDDVEINLQVHKPEQLYGTGDFRSFECIELLKEADIVVTNPPFSLFREYVAQLMEYDKKFLIIGHQNAITYKEIFKFIMENKIWLGFGFKGGAAHFISHYKDVAVSSNHKPGMIRVSGVVWFTNLDHKKRHEKLEFHKEYTPEEYPHYDNYDAIEVSKTALIPEDYDGMMGVPITFLEKYCPEQFEIVGMAKRGAGDPALRSKVYTKIDYPNYSDLNATPTLFDSNGKLHNTYPRLLIRKIK
ncbi:MAG: adenine-specific methyltransferase EcoRI family protein [Prevotella sp.]|nr:adenine-specific methyltransferase EcoRI family protein [Prevotella sp.]